MARYMVSKIASVALGAALLAGLLAAPPAIAKDKKNKAPQIDVSVLAWPPPPQVARVKYLASYTGQDIKPKQKQGLLEKLAGIPEVQSRDFLLKPYGVAVDSKGRAYVTDTQQRLVFIFDFDKKEVGFRGDKPPANLKTPIGIALDSHDRLFVTDSDFHTVTVFDPEGKVLQVFGEEELVRPAGIAIDEALDRLYVADVKNRRIAIFQLSTFKFQRWMGRSSTPGSEKEMLPDDKRTDLTPLIAPTNLAVDPEGLLYISDAYNAQIIVLDQDGNQVRVIGEIGDGPGQFGRPRGIAFDSDGHLYVVDAMNNRVQMLTSDGKPMMPVGKQGYRPGEFSVPAGIAVDKNNRIIVSDQYNRRIQVFRYVTDAEAGGQTKKVADASEKRRVEESKTK